MSELQEYKCPCCGGAIEFDSKAQKMKCPYCDTEFEVDTISSYNSAINEETPENMSWEHSAGGEWDADERDGLRVYICRSCGGEIVGDETLAATACPYCDNPVVMTGQFCDTMKPDIVIPFKLDKKDAIAALKRHYSGKRFLPKVFKDENHIKEVKGVYVPFWLFSADADANARYKATRTRVWSDSSYNYTETSYYSVHRSGSIGFDSIPVDGSSKVDDTLMESIEPYRYEDAVDFKTAYLAGYLADKYDVDADASIGRANERIKNSTAEAFRSTVSGYSSVTSESCNVQLKNGSSKYALLPVWILNTDWNGKKYTFAMNGQTGKIVGDLPLDKGAYWRCFMAAAGITFAASMVVQYLFHII